MFQLSPTAMTRRARVQIQAAEISFLVGWPCRLSLREDKAAAPPQHKESTEVLQAPDGWSHGTNQELAEMFVSFLSWERGNIL